VTVSENWTEVLRCSACALAGVASLSQVANGTLIVKNLPIGFRSVSTEYGDTFYCAACDRAASSSTK